MNYEYSGIFVNTVRANVFFSDVICVSEKSYFKKNWKQWPNPDIIYSIPKLCIQNNLLNIINYKNKYFFIFIKEYRIKELKKGILHFLKPNKPLAVGEFAGTTLKRKLLT